MPLDATMGKSLSKITLADAGELFFKADARSNEWASAYIDMLGKGGRGRNMIANSNRLLRIQQNLMDFVLLEVSPIAAQPCFIIYDKATY